jgi:hypothetical protein
MRNMNYSVLHILHGKGFSRVYNDRVIFVENPDNQLQTKSLSFSNLNLRL